ncbi:MAG: MFS transporter, partial [Actinomycetes bacterium]
MLLALDRTRSAAIAGVLVAALLIPHVVAAPGVGWLTDRARRPRLVLTGAALGFAGSLAAVALLLGRVPLVAVVAVLLAGGCCGPALTGGLTSQLAGLVRKPGLPRAFGADSLTYNVSGIAGPAVAGTLAGLWGAGPATFTLAAVAAGGAAVLACLPLAARPSATSAASPPLTAGAKAVIGNPVLRTVTLASSLGQLGPGALAVVAAVLATAQGRPAATGWLLSSVAVGGLLGSLWWTWRPAATAHAARTVMLSLVGVGVPLALAAASPSSLTLTATLFALSGIALGPFTGAIFTTRQAQAPEGARAQVFTISAGLKTTTAAAGAAIAGGIAHLPVSTQLLFVGVTPVLAGALGALALVRTAPPRQPPPGARPRGCTNTAPSIDHPSRGPVDSRARDLLPCRADDDRACVEGRKESAMAVTDGVPTTPGESYETRPFLKIRRGYRDVLWAARTKDIVHGLVEIDVTRARRVLRRRRAAGEDISFTAFLLYAVGRAVDEDRVLHAYRRRNRLVIFDEVDANTQIEAEVSGQRIVKSIVLRAVNRKTVEQLSRELRDEQRPTAASDRRYRGTVTFLALPLPVRRLAWRIILGQPGLFKRLGGTIAISSIG